MRTFQIAVLAGAAALLSSGAFGFAAAQVRATHVMTLRLPGGTVEQIRYAGDVAPKVDIDAQSLPIGFGWPVAFFDAAPFAALDRLSADMDRRMAQTLEQANALSAQSLPGAPGTTAIDWARLPAGSESYSYVSSGAGNVFCAKSVQITSRGHNQKPQVVSRSYGNCTSAGPAERQGTRSEAESSARQQAARSIDYVEPASGDMLRDASVAR